MDEMRREAEAFVRDETAFHLGALPTEQSHPLTRGLAELTAADTVAGVRLLLRVDQDVVAAARRVVASAAYAATVAQMQATLAGGGRICFSGCGATGRLSILLESAWRAGGLSGALGEAVVSLMTGGDFALVRSVENFEDYQSFGRQQVRELGLGPGDLLVAVTEGGETSSVIGTAWQALEQGAAVVFACNNPLDLLAAQVARSREILADPRVVGLDLSSGPMAVAGSTRMQATSSELLLLGAALEEALATHLGTAGPWADRTAVADRFAGLLAELTAAPAVAAMAQWVDLEAATYAAGGAVTYYADEFLLDVFTDTTERSPTFCLPPFRRHDDRHSPRPWAFVKCPLRSTAATWERLLRRPLRCLDWSPELYAELGAAEAIRRQPPALDRAAVLGFWIGYEREASRWAQPTDRALLLAVGSEAPAVRSGADLRECFDAAAADFPRRQMVYVGSPGAAAAEHLTIACELPASPLRLAEHLAVKLVLNTVSTATAAKLGRLRSNWMCYVETTNKKLIDRGTRLVAELAGLEYGEACYQLHLSRAQIAAAVAAGRPRQSPVAVTLERLGRA
ncbi:MAG: SIS domain-containing protein [Fimbriimonadaceae bacterium]|nr:SIS domain-containing protein [Fimbriimonadaceae bacterium]